MSSLTSDSEDDWQSLDQNLHITPPATPDSGTGGSVASLFFLPFLPPFSFFFLPIFPFASRYVCEDMVEHAAVSNEDGSYELGKGNDGWGSASPWSQRRSGEALQPPSFLNLVQLSPATDGEDTY